MSLPLVNEAPALVRLSGLAYARPLDIQRGLDALGLRLVESFARNDTEALLVARLRQGYGGQAGAEYAALAFRGTEATALHWRDLKSNLGIPVRWAGEGRAHSGYVRHLAMIENQAVAMAEGVASEHPLYVTGHSMGGALATLFAALWYALGRNYRLAGLVTFGAPKALSQAAAAPIACPTLRVVNRFDFAPHWPPLILSHPNAPHRIDSGGWPGPISRHAPGRYVEALSGRAGSDAG